MNKFLKITTYILLLGGLFMPLNTKALTKNETVYINLENDGQVSKTKVSNHLTFKDQQEVLDETYLENILNINGKETFKKEGNKLTWTSQGSDIFYQGTITKQLPITTSITYYLNDKEMPLKKMLGKKGHITIELTFTNQQQQQVKIANKYQTMTTPFIVSMGTILDGKTNRNVEVTNGKAISTGKRTMVVALASPGLATSLSLEELDTLDTITLSYDTNKFSLNNIYLVATPKLLETSDLQVFDKLDRLANNMTSLQENMNQLERGLQALNNGTTLLVDGSTALNDNLTKALTALSKLQSGAMDIEFGLIEALHSLEGAETLLNQQMGTDKLKELEVLKNANQNAINTLLEEMHLSYAQLLTTYQQYSLENYQGDDANLLAIKSSTELIQLLMANNEALDQTMAMTTDLIQQVNQLMSALTTGLTELTSGSKQLSDGLKELDQGLNQITLGASTLTEGAKNLNQGVTTLATGASTLNQEGIKKLTAYAQLIKQSSAKLEALNNLSKDYHGYASDNSDTTQFVYMVKAFKTNK